MNKVLNKSIITSYISVTDNSNGRKWRILMPHQIFLISVQKCVSKKMFIMLHAFRVLKLNQQLTVNDKVKNLLSKGALCNTPCEQDTSYKCYPIKKSRSTFYWRQQYTAHAFC